MEQEYSFINKRNNRKESFVMGVVHADKTFCDPRMTRGELSAPICSQTVSHLSHLFGE